MPSQLHITRTCTPPVTGPEFAGIAKDILDDAHAAEGQLTHEGDSFIFHRYALSSHHVTRTQVKAKDGRMITIGGDGPRQFLVALCKASELIDLDDWEKRYRLAQALNVAYANAEMGARPEDPIAKARLKRYIGELLQRVPEPPPPSDDEEKATTRKAALTWMRDHADKCKLDLCNPCALWKSYLWVTDTDFHSALAKTAYEARSAVPKNRAEMIHDYTQGARYVLAAALVSNYVTVKLEENKGEVPPEHARMISTMIAKGLRSFGRNAVMHYYYMRSPAPKVVDVFATGNSDAVRTYLNPYDKKLREALDNIKMSLLDYEGLVAVAREVV